MNPQLTVLMPVSHVDHHLALAIHSIKIQTYTNYVCYILVPPLTDHESRDLCLLISDDSRFFIHEISLGGITFALNFGLNITKTKYVARMDGDDISKADRFEKQINFLESNPSYVLVGCRVNLIDGVGNIMKQRFKFYESNEEIRRALKFRMPLCHPAMIFRTDTMLENKGYMYGNTAEDHELYLRIARNHSKLMYNLPVCLFSYRRHDRQLTNIKHARAAYCNIAGFLFTEFLITYDPFYLIGILANHPGLRRLRMFFRQLRGI